MKKFKRSFINRGKIFDLARMRGKLPNGRSIDYTYISHPGAVVIISFFKNKVVLIWQYRAVIGKYIYELPAGTINKNEKPLACAKRELIEETGYAADKMNYITGIYPVPGYSTELLKIYKAAGLKKVKGCTEEDEIIDVKMFSKTQIRSLFKSGKIIDAKTIAGLAMVGWL